MERTLISELNNRVGETVSISGWVDVRRDQGKMIFFDFRDRSIRLEIEIWMVLALEKNFFFEKFNFNFFLIINNDYCIFI